MSLKVKRRLTRVLLGLLLLISFIVVVKCSKEDAVATYEIIDEPAPISVIDEEIYPEEDFENEKIEEALLNKANKIENCVVTHYCAEKYNHICGTGDGIGFDGTPVVPYVTCAVDRSVIPIGSTVIVDRDGELCYYVATDTGVSGNHIDICVEKHSEALELGTFNTTVYWVKE